LTVFEVEVKFRLDGQEEADRVKSTLENLGAKLLGEVLEEDIYFAHPCRDFAKTDEALRVRVVKQGTTEEVLLTYKGPRLGGEGKSRKEITVQVDNRDRLVELLQSLGFNPVINIRKRRLVYTKESYTVTIDEVEGLGYFVEIETTTSSEDLISKCVEDIMKFASALGLSSNKVEKKTYLELLLERVSVG